MNGERDANEGGSAAKLPPSLVDEVARAIGATYEAAGWHSYWRYYLPQAEAAIAVMIDDLRALMGSVDTEYAGYVRAIIHRWERGET